MSFLSRLCLVFTAGDELESLVSKAKKKKRDAEIAARAEHLNLCEKHQQERNRSHFAEHNCDYCKLLEKNKDLMFKFERGE